MEFLTRRCARQRRIPDQSPEGTPAAAPSSTPLTPRGPTCFFFCLQYFGATLSALGVALKSGTTAGYLVVAATLLCYTIVIPVEKHYFAHIDEKRKRRVSSKLE